MSPQTDTSASSPLWHVTARDGKQGPLTLAQVEELAASGRITSRSLAWKPGMAAWQPSGMIPELAALFGRATPPAEVWGARLARFLKKLRGIEEEVRPRIQQIDTSRFRFSRRQWTLAGLLALVLGGFWAWRSFIYAAPHDEFLGVFLGEIARNQWTEIVKLEKRGDKYQLFERVRGKWAGPQEMKPMDEKALAGLFGEDWMDSRPIGLANPTGLTAILHVPEGWEPEDFVCTTGYIILKPDGPIQIMRKETTTPALPSLRAKVSPTPTPEPTETARPKSASRATKPETGERTAEAQPAALTLPRSRPRQSRKEPSRSAQTAAAIVTPGEEEAVVPTELPGVATPRPAAKPHATESPKMEETASQPAAPMRSAILRATSPSAPVEAPAVSAEPAIVPQVPASAPPTSRAESAPAPTASPTPAMSKPAPGETSSQSSVASARGKAEGARARLAAASAAGRTTLKEQFLKSGDALLKTSQDRAASKDSEGAVFYAERAEATYRQGEEAVTGGK